MPRKRVAKRVAKRAVRRVAKRTTAKKATTFIIRIGRFGSNPVSVRVKTGATVRQALTRGKVSLPTGGKVWLNGARAGFSSKVKRGDIISIVSRKQAQA